MPIIPFITDGKNPTVVFDPTAFQMGEERSGSSMRTKSNSNLVAKTATHRTISALERFIVITEI